MQNGVRARIEECAKTARYHITNLMAETNSLTVIKNAVLEGMGLTILPISAVISELERELMVAQEIVNPSVSCTVSVCWPKSITNHAALCVARLIVAVATEVRATDQWPGAQAAHDRQS
jgi:LysR family nitrogen assimilation transcriptional regulator